MPQAVQLRICVSENYQTGYVVRSLRLVNGKESLQLLSRYGEWVPCTQEQIDEQDIPSYCIFATHELSSKTDFSTD